MHHQAGDSGPDCGVKEVRPMELDGWHEPLLSDSLPLTIMPSLSPYVVAVTADHAKYPSTHRCSIACAKAGYDAEAKIVAVLGGKRPDRPPGSFEKWMGQPECFWPP